MLRTAWLLAAAALFSGCAAHEPSVVVVHEVLPPPADNYRPPNLVLGPSAEHARLGEWFAARSDWPSMESGMRLEEVSTYIDATYDDQAYYDRFGGAFFKVQESVRTGVFVR